MSTLQAEIVEEPQSMALAVHEPPAPPALFGTTDPSAIIQKATVVANALKGVIKSQGLISNISGKEYPRCEAWTLLGTMLGIFPVLIWTRKLEDGWEARVEARTRDGAIVGAAEAQCCKSERNWGNRDDFALRSMCQTRATAKALRMPLGFVMSLSGLEVTPAEEMTAEMVQGKSPPGQSKRAVDRTVAQRQGTSERVTPENQAQPTNQAGVGDDDLAWEASKPAQAGPASAPKPTATEAQKAKMLNELKANPGEENVEIVTEYFAAIAWLLPTESISDLQLRYVPVTAKQMRDLGACIAAFSNGDQAKSPYEPNDGMAQPAQSNPGQPYDAPNAPWRSFPVPFGKNAGITLGKLDKKPLFGFWANYTVETEYNGRPIAEAKVAQNRKFREMLDQAGLHYGFTKPEDKR